MARPVAPRCRGDAAHGCHRHLSRMAVVRGREAVVGLRLRLRTGERATFTASSASPRPAGSTSVRWSRAASRSTRSTTRSRPWRPARSFAASSSEPRLTGSRRGRARVGCSGWDVPRLAAAPVYPLDLPQRRWFEHYARCSTPSRSTTPSTGCRRATTVEGWAATGTARLRLRPEARAVRLASHEAAGRGLVAPEPRRSRRSGSAPPLGPTLVQLPPRWHATPSVSTSSWRRAARRCVGRSSCASRRGCTTTSSRCSQARCRAVHARSAGRSPMGAHDRLDLRPLPRTRRAANRSTRDATAAVDSGGSPIGWVIGSTRDVTSTRTSTTTTRASWCTMPAGWPSGCSDDDDD